VRVVVLGGGLTGLVAADALAQAGVTAPVLEREPEAGGACRTVERDGFRFDLTGHLLHVGRDETVAYLERIGVWRELEVHERRAAVAVGDRITPYPVQIHTHGLADEVRRDCLLGFVRAWASRDDASRPATFRDWVLERFGEGLARHFFFPYNRKLFRAEPEELSLDWIGRYVPKPGLEEVVDGALGLHRERVGYNAVFRYPADGGIRAVPDAVAGRLGDLRTGVEVVRLHLAERWLETASGERVPWDLLVATVALPGLVDMVCDRRDPEIDRARSRLRWVRVVNLALGVEGPPPRPEHWLYFPDESLPFYRVGIPSNHGRLAPPGCHTLSVEASLPPAEGDPADLARRCDAALVGLGLLAPDRVRCRHVAVLDPAYVVFDHRRRQAVARLRGWLGEHGVLLSGRWAEWKYSAMEDAVLDGHAVARRIAAGR